MNKVGNSVYVAIVNVIDMGSSRISEWGPVRGSMSNGGTYTGHILIITIDQDPYIGLTSN